MRERCLRILNSPIVKAASWRRWGTKFHGPSPRSAERGTEPSSASWVNALTTELKVRKGAVPLPPPLVPFVRKGLGA